MVMTVGMVDPKASDMGARARADQGGVVWSPGASPPTWACFTTVGWSWQQGSQRWPQGGGQSGPLDFVNTEGVQISAISHYRDSHVEILTPTTSSSNFRHFSPYVPLLICSLLLFWMLWVELCLLQVHILPSTSSSAGRG